MYDEINDIKARVIKPDLELNNIGDCNMTKSEYYSTTQIATRMSVTPAAVRYWIRSRGLKAVNLPGGKYAVRKEWLQVWLMSHGNTTLDIDNYLGD